MELFEQASVSRLGTFKIKKSNNKLRIDSDVTSGFFDCTSAASAAAHHNVRDAVGVDGKMRCAKSDSLKLSRAVSSNETGPRGPRPTCSAVLVEAKFLAHLRSVGSAHGGLQNHSLVQRPLCS